MSESYERATPDLIEAFSHLQSLLLTTSSVGTFLNDLAQLAGRLVDPPGSVGITLRRPGHGQPFTVAWSDDRASAVDEVQYGQGAGPCLDGLDTGLMVDVPDLQSDRRWNGYRPHALKHGVRSSLSLPLTVGGTTIGALNVYATEPNAFGDTERHTLRVFAAHSAAALTMVLRQDQQAEVSAQLESALSSRTIIDQALGIIMAQQRCSADDAFALLRTRSQHSNQKLRDVAADLIVRITGVPPSPPPPFTRRDHDSAAEEH